MTIQEAELFKGMSKEIINEIAEIMVEESYGEGDFLFQEGDPANYFYILEEGSVRLSFEEKGYIIFTLCNSGKPIGWGSLVGVDFYRGRAECAVRSKVIRIEKESLNKLFEKYSADGLIFFKNLTKIISQRLIKSLLSAYRRESAPSFG